MRLNDKVKIICNLGRMCDYFRNCQGCKIKMVSDDCVEFYRNYPEDAVKIIEEWANEHLPTTYKTDFLNNFPNAKLDKDSYPIVCRKDIYGGFCESGNYFCHDCWNEPMME